MVSAFKEKQSSYPVVPKNGSTGKSQSDAVLPKNGSILINTINETDNEIINDTSLGFAQQTDAKKRKGNTGGFFSKNPPDPLKTFHCVQRAKKCSGFFCLA